LFALLEKLVRLSLKHIVTSLIPVVVLLILTAMISFTLFQDIEEESAKERMNSAQVAARRVDKIFYNLSRAASEFVNRRNSIEAVTEVVQEGTLSDFFNAYLDGVMLNVQITGLDNRVVFRSWDSLFYGDIAPLIQQGAFEPKIIELNGSSQFAVALPIVNLKNQRIGNILVASKIDEKFLNEVSPNLLGVTQIGSGSKIIVQSASPKQGENSARVNLKIIPSVWIGYSSTTETLFGHLSKNGHLFRNVSVIAFLLGLFFLSGYLIWRITEQEIISPITKIYSVIIDGADLKIIEKLPNNEIGILGQALLNQKILLENKSLVLSAITDQFKKEAALVKVLSHDLATPLLVVKFSANKLSHLIVDNDLVNNHVAKIIKQTSNIENILLHVKQMKALETGKKKLPLKEINFGLIIHEIATTFQQQLSSKRSLLIGWSLKKKQLLSQMKSHFA
jgi:hypothetical protein